MSLLHNIPSYRMNAVILSVIAVIGISACTPNKRIMESSVPAANTEERPVKPRTFADDIESMKIAEFTFIYVLRRKDGSVIDAEDKEFINSMKPSEINRVSLSDEGKAVIFGSNFRLPSDIIKELSERFSFEDISKPDADNKIDEESKSSATK